MRTVRWLVAAGLLASATGCVEMNGYPGTSYGGYPSGYGGYPGNGYYGSNYGGYYGQPTYSSGNGLFGNLFNSQPNYYYQPPPPQVVTQTRYVPVPVANASRPSWGGRDRNHNGVPDWRERDRNGDGVPDWQQRRGRSG